MNKVKLKIYYALNPKMAKSHLRPILENDQCASTTKNCDKRGEMSCSINIEMIKVNDALGAIDGVSADVFS